MNEDPPDWFVLLCRFIGYNVLSMILGALICGVTVNDAWERSAIASGHGTYTKNSKGHVNFTWLVQVSHQNPTTIPK